jgi:alkanesulfonate monooxygenase SsuD/methylene tetrahydromethanopterin reductase-like flavin-dependent oxidoreductase (luciferase family)
MQYGAHLPLIAFGNAAWTLADVCAYARRAAELDYRFLCANDHLFFARPWLDGPTALAATLEASADMTIATTVALPVIRGPVQTAKVLAALDRLSGGRLVAGLGPGSSPRDYAAVGVAFEERWKRFDEAVRTIRSTLAEEDEARQPPLWIASWGSAAGMRRVARLGDGWLASGYNTTPDAFASGRAGLPDDFPNAIATMWLYVTDSQREADRMLADVLAPMLGRPVGALRDLALPIGSPQQCAERIGAYAQAGAQRVFVWPLADELRQLEVFREQVVPLVEAAGPSSGPP